MTKPTRQEIYIFDHPESRIRFLEASLTGDDWRAAIVIPPNESPNPVLHARLLERQLKARGYATRIEEDGTGTALVHLHHFGKTSSPVEALREMGLTQGTAFAVEHGGSLVGHSLMQAANFFSYVVKEPARLFNGFYLGGDAFMSAAEMFHKPTSTPTPAALKTPVQPLGRERAGRIIGTVGTLGNWAQSLIDLKYAQSGAEVNYNELHEAFNAGQNVGIDATNFQAWSDPKLRQNALSPFTDAAKRHPLETGSWAMIVSQLSFITSRAIDISIESPKVKGVAMPPRSEWSKLIRLDENATAASAGKVLERQVSQDEMVHLGAFKKILGARINMLRAALSITGWQMFITHHGHHDHMTGWTQNPLKRLNEEIDNHTAQAAAVFTSAAGLVGLTAAAFSRNRLQMAAESIWLAGDCIIFLVNKDHYGERGANQEMPLIEAASKFLKAVPVALGPQAEANMMHDLSVHLATRTVKGEERDTKIQNPEKMQADIERLSAAIEAGLKANIAAHQTIFKKLAYQSAFIAAKFGPEKAPMVIEKMSESLAQTPSLHATKDEWKSAMEAAIKTIAPTDRPVQSVAQLSNDIAQLVLTSPGTSNAGVAMAVYDSVASFLPRSPMGVSMLQKAIASQATQQLNLTPAQVAAMNAATQHASVPARA